MFLEKGGSRNNSSSGIKSNSINIKNEAEPLFEIECKSQENTCSYLNRKTNRCGINEIKIDKSILEGFENLNFFLYGYMNEKYLDFFEFITRNKGVVEKNLNQEVNWIIVNSEKNYSYKDLCSLKIQKERIMSDRWIRDCIREERFISSFDDYLFSTKLISIETENIISENEYLKTIFKGLVFAIDKRSCKPDISCKIEDVISKRGGILENNISSNIMYIICDNLNEMEKILSYQKETNDFKAFFINSDCILQGLESTYRHDQMIHEEIQSDISKKYITHDIKLNLIKTSYSPTKPKTSCLKDLTFFVSERSYIRNPNKLNLLKFQIKDATIVDDGNWRSIVCCVISESVNYIIMNDQYEEKYNKMYDQIIVSHRFIDFCTVKREVINNFLSNSLYCFCAPSQFSFPLLEFMDNKIKIYFSDFSRDDIFAIKYLVQTLGGSCETNGEITHLICKKWTMEEIFLDYKNCLSKSVKVVNVNWLIDCFSRGFQLEVEEYLVT
jgi:hypothetical protein